MENNEVSLHQVTIFLFVRRVGRWVTNAEIAAGTGYPERTVRLHTRTFVSEGMFDRAEVYPGHRFRMATKAEMRNKGYYLRIQQAIEVFGLDSSA